MNQAYGFSIWVVADPWPTSLSSFLLAHAHADMNRLHPPHVTLACNLSSAVEAFCLADKQAWTNASFMMSWDCAASWRGKDYDNDPLDAWAIDVDLKRCDGKALQLAHVPHLTLRYSHEQEDMPDCHLSQASLSGKVVVADTRHPDPWNWHVISPKPPSPA